MIVFLRVLIARWRDINASMTYVHLPGLCLSYRMYRCRQTKLEEDNSVEPVDGKKAYRVSAKSLEHFSATGTHETWHCANTFTSSIESRLSVCR